MQAGMLIGHLLEPRRMSDDREIVARKGEAVLELAIPIMERERSRRVHQATIEHLIAQVFVILTGMVFVAGIVLLFSGVITAGIVSSIGAVIPLFLSRVFSKRERDIEKEIKPLVDDIRASERARESLQLASDVIDAIPERYRDQVMNEVLSQRAKRRKN